MSSNSPFKSKQRRGDDRRFFRIKAKTVASGLTFRLEFDETKLFSYRSNIFERHAMTIPFDQLFQKLQNGTIGPKAPVQIGDIRMTPGVAFGSGVKFAGVDLAALAGSILDVDFVNGIYVIKGAH